MGVKYMHVYNLCPVPQLGAWGMAVLPNSVPFPCDHTHLKALLSLLLAVSLSSPLMKTQSPYSFLPTHHP